MTMLLRLRNVPLAQLSKRLCGSAAPAIQTVEREDKCRQILINWDDGSSGKFPYVWLRDNCPAEHTYHLGDESKARNMLFKDLDIKVTPIKVENKRTGINIIWPGDKDGFYSSQWLKQRNISDDVIRQHRKNAMLHTERISWDKKSFSKIFRTFDWNQCFSDGRSLHDALTFLNSYGILLLDGVPEQKGQALKLGEELGYIKPSHYGETFDVVANPAPTNLAYTARELGLHTDLPYFEMMPEIQGLHCIRAAGEGLGGESIFVDTFEVAKQIKSDNPDHYRILCTVPLEYVDDTLDGGRHYQQVARHPVFNIGEDGNLKFTAWNNQMRSWYYDVPVDQVDDVYEAMNTFHQYCLKPENTMCHRLKAGQFVIFDNLRVMHGREAYEVTSETDRCLQGIYYTWDAVRSKIRCLRTKFGIEPQYITV